MPTSPPTITAAGAIPDPSDRPTYNSRAYAFMLWMKNAVTQFADVATNVYNNATETATNATTASAASTAAIAASGATKWVSGVSVTQGACVWSPISGQTYRRTAATGSGTTDPSADGANYTQISGASLALNIVTTTTVTAAAGQQYALTNVAATAVTLPPAPNAGDIVAITPCNGLSTNTVARNGNTIMGFAEDLLIDSASVTVTLRYINATAGWRII